MLLNPVFINMLMSTPHLEGPTSIELIKNTVARGLFIAVKYAKSRCVYITPTKILEIANSPYARYPRTKVEVRNILNNLCMHGLAEYVGFRAKRNVYCITEKSPLWDAIKKSDGPEDVLRFIEKYIP
jgi:hypothetical protein